MLVIVFVIFARKDDIYMFWTHLFVCHGSWVARPQQETNDTQMSPRDQNKYKLSYNHKYKYKYKHRCLPESKTNTNIPTIILRREIMFYDWFHNTSYVLFHSSSYKWTVGKEEHAVGRLLWFSETMTLFNKIEIKWWNITTKRCNVTKACVGNRVRFVKWLYLCVVLVMEPLNCDSCLVWKMKKVWSAW